MCGLDGLVTINGIDIWSEFGAFLTEEKAGGRENLTAIMAPSKVKSHVGVNIREHDGTKYSDKLDVKNEEREVTLHFAIFAPTVTGWLTRYRAFITFLKQGADGWLSFNFPPSVLPCACIICRAHLTSPLHIYGRRGFRQAVSK